MSVDRTPVTVMVRTRLESPQRDVMVSIPDNPARCTQSTKHDRYGIHGMSREEAVHLAITIGNSPLLRYISCDLLRMLYPDEMEAANGNRNP